MNEEQSLVRLWLLIENDRGYGETVVGAYPSESEAQKNCTSNERIEYLDVPWENLSALNPKK
jgi:hypothetical protein